MSPPPREPNPMTRGVVLACALAPLGALPLMNPELIHAPWPRLLRTLVALEVPFLGIPLALWATYRLLVGPLVRRKVVRDGWLLHVVMALGVAPAVSVALAPVHGLVLGAPMQLPLYVVQSAVFSVAFVLPAALVERLRERERRLEVVAQAQARATLEAKVDALVARTQPHFLFNALNTVATLIPENPELAERTVERLADHFRYALEVGGSGSVPVSREVQMVRDYLAIQQARFEALRVSVEVDDALSGCLVPPLVLQPLVENAVLHGGAPGSVVVRGLREGEEVRFEVEDSGPGPGRSEHRGSQTSLADLRARLALRYGARATLTLEAGTHGGCVARLWVPA